VIKVPKFIIFLLKLIGIYNYSKFIYYKYLRFFKLIKDNLENNLFSIFLNSSDEIQFIDVGCYKGSKIDCIMNINSYSRVIGIEPFVNYYEKLKKKYINKNNVKILNYAISDKNEYKNFYYNNNITDKEAFSLIKQNKLNKIQKIKCVKLTEILKKKKISIIKIDTEGSEFTILNASKEILKNQRPVFFVETTNLTYKRVCNLFKINNYKVFVYEINIFKKKLKNNWIMNNVVKNDEYNNELFCYKKFLKLKKNFMFNIIAIPFEKQNKLQNIKIQY